MSLHQRHAETPHPRTTHRHLSSSRWLATPQQQQHSHHQHHIQRQQHDTSHSNNRHSLAAASPAPGGTKRRAVAAGAGGSSGSREDEVWGQLSRMADKYLFAGGATPQQHRSRSRSTLPVQAIHVLLCSYAVVWLLTTPLPAILSTLSGSSSSSIAVSASSSGGALIPIKLLSLDHISSSGSGGAGWLARLLCPLTDALLSPSSGLLARNLFMGYMFGRVVDNTEGGTALVGTFVLSALGGTMACLALLPRRAPLTGCAATAAMFGLFAAATVFNRHKQWHWQRGFELVALTPFVVQQLLAGHSSSGLTHYWCSLLGGLREAAWVPLLGGFAGAAAAAGLWALVRALQAAVDEARQQQQQQRRRHLGEKQPGGGKVGGGGEGAEKEAPVSALLARAAAQLLKKALSGGS